jgi:hypothetical protein
MAGPYLLVRKVNYHVLLVLLNSDYFTKFDKTGRNNVCNFPQFIFKIPCDCKYIKAAKKRPATIASIFRTYLIAIQIGISLPIELVKKIDKERHDVSRSRYILRLIEKNC